MQPAPEFYRKGSTALGFKACFYFEAASLARDPRVPDTEREHRPVPSPAMRLRVAAAVLLSAAAYYVNVPLPSDVNEPWKLMLLHALLRSFMHAVSNDDGAAPGGPGGCDVTAPRPLRTPVSLKLN